MAEKLGEMRLYCCCGGLEFLFLLVLLPLYRFFKRRRQEHIDSCSCDCHESNDRLANRVKEKDDSRKKDAEVLESGEKTPEDLGKENGCFVFPDAKLVSPKRKLK